MSTGTMDKCLLPITGAFHSDGGIAAVNRLVIRSIAEKGFGADIYALDEQDDSVDTYYIDPSKTKYRVFRGNKLAFTASVWKACYRNSYKFVLSDHVNPAAILAPLAILKRCRYLVWLYGMEVFPPLPSWEGRLGMTYAWKRLAISQFTRQSVALRFPNLSFEICELAVDPIRHGKELPNEPICSPPALTYEAIDGSTQLIGSKLILFVGRMTSFEQYKGQDSLLKAFPKIFREFPQAQLLLAGQGDDLPRLLNLAKSLPDVVHNNIFLPGFVSIEQLEYLYQTCFLLAMPSTGEGFGLVYLEAMAHAKPCLGGKLDAAPCVIRDGLSGVLVEDPKSPDQVAAKIIELLSNQDRARAMGLNGYALIRDYYLFPHFHERFWDVISS